MTGAETAWKTLSRDQVDEPCIIAAWMMKRDFFRKYAAVDDIYADPVATAVEAFANAGCNLNPQFIMPSPFQEHRACNPRSIPTESPREIERVRDRRPMPEDVFDDVDRALDSEPESDGLRRDEAGDRYARNLLELRERSNDRTLYIGGFAMPSFMSGYTRWTYESYLSALLLDPDRFKRYFMWLGKAAREKNEAIVGAVRRHAIAPFVYSGDDICFNDGPICSVELLDEIYFPALRHAIEPLTDAGIEIIWHCDGNVLPIAPRLISCGIAGFQGFQEREARIPLEEMAALRRADGGKLIFFGSVSVVHTFPFAAEAEMKREIERCFRVAAPGGGFCLAPTSSVLPETPMENIDTFLNYGREFGRRFLATC